MNGNIIDIKRFSVHDGPGIRTTIFLKGCSLSCLWCHNPESISSKPEIGFFENKCINCGKCARICPTGAHLQQNGKHILKHDLCTACGTCVDVCLLDAIEYYGREMSVDEVIEEVLEDATFYRESNGGCTFSGGEPLLQPEFCADVFNKLKKEGVHCAIDTSGAVKWGNFKKVIPHTDLFLYDIKHLDDQKHREQVGSSNSIILENLKRLSKCDVPIEIRIPIIPGFNDDEQSMTAVGEFLSGLKNISGVRLLPYHLAHSKYMTVGHQDTMPNVSPPTMEKIDAFASRLKNFGLKIKS